jgi:hypothetical protein
MEQEKVVHKLTTTSRLTIKSLANVLEALGGWLGYRIANRNLSGEQTYYRLLNHSQSTPLTSTQLNQSVDLMKLRTLLNEQGLAFAFKTNLDQTTTLFFKVKDQALAKNAFEKGFEDLMRDPQAFADKVTRDPNKQTFEEKVKAGRETVYQQQQATAQLSKSSVDNTQTLVKGKVK